jgi:hypothetical protein
MADIPRRRVAFFHFLMRATLIHIVTFALVAAFSILILGQYPDLYSHPVLNNGIRLKDHFVFRIAPWAQILRGLVLGAVLYPLRDLLMARRGWIMMSAILVALQILAAPSGIIESTLYTEMPVWFSLLSVPGLVAQLVLFTLLLYLWERRIAAVRQKALSRNV